MHSFHTGAVTGVLMSGMGFALWYAGEQGLHHQYTQALLGWVGTDTHQAQIPFARWANITP